MTMTYSRHDLSFIALGANLPHPQFGLPQATLTAAIESIADAKLTVVARSHWYETAPVPLADQPWYVNGVIAVRSELAPEEILRRLHEIEARFGRVRAEVNAPRVVDLDLLDHRGEVRAGDTAPVLPHPRMAVRGFVLLPLRDIAPDWRHPVTGQGLAELIAALPADQVTRRLGSGSEASR